MKKDRQNSSRLLWEKFIHKHPEYSSEEEPDSFYFCDNEKDANECAALVVKGIKQATATSKWWYDTHNEALPQIGDLYIVTDWNGNAKAIIKTTKVSPTHTIKSQKNLPKSKVKVINH